MRERLRGGAAWIASGVFSEGTVPSTNLQVEYKRSDMQNWVSLNPMVAGTAGSLASNEYADAGYGVIEIGMPSASLTSGQHVIVRVSGDDHTAIFVWHDIGQTRDALEPELGRIDVNVGSRSSHGAPDLGDITTAVNNSNDRSGWLLAILAGEISNADSATETFTIILNGDQYQADYSGLDTDGNRSLTTLSKSGA